MLPWGTAIVEAIVCAKRSSNRRDTHEGSGCTNTIFDLALVLVCVPGLAYRYAIRTRPLPLRERPRILGSDQVASEGGQRRGAEGGGSKQGLLEVLHGVGLSTMMPNNRPQYFRIPSANIMPKRMDTPSTAARRELYTSHRTPDVLCDLRAPRLTTCTELSISSSL